MVPVDKRLRELMELSLANGRDEQTRVRIAAGLRDILDADLTPEQRAIANDIASNLARDVALAVRKTLVARLFNCAFLPRETAMALARDIAARTDDLLQASPVFRDEDLLELAQTLDPRGLVALAGRPGLPAPAGLEIARRGDETAARTLVQNPSAGFPELLYDALIGHFASVTDLMDGLAAHHDAPLTVLKKLVDLMSDAMRDSLVSDHELGPDLAAYLAEDTRRHSLIAMMMRATDRQIDKLVRDLDSKGELTPIFVLYAMQQGATRFFEVVLAVRNGISLDQVRLTMQDPDTRRVNRLVDKAGLGETLLKEYRRLIRSQPASGW
jgi:uncharacterized protein (DUF2336 family)